MNIAYSLLLVFAILVLFLGVFIKVAHSLRKGGGSMTTVSLGATDAFYHKEKKEIMAEIVNRKANKKVEEQETDTQKDSDNQTRF